MLSNRYRQINNLLPFLKLLGIFYNAYAQNCFICLFWSYQKGLPQQPIPYLTPIDLQQAELCFHVIEGGLGKYLGDKPA